MVDRVVGEPDTVRGYSLDHAAFDQGDSLGNNLFGSHTESSHTESSHTESIYSGEHSFAHPGDCLSASEKDDPGPAQRDFGRISYANPNILNQ
jgi:hypothetical protein